MRCIRCGRPLREGGRVGALCVDCFLETHRLLCIPDLIVFDYCKYCGSIRFGHRWLDGGELGEAINKYIELFMDSSHITVCKDSMGVVEDYWFIGAEPLTVPSWRTLYRVGFKFRLRDVDELVEQWYRVEVRARPTICPLCKDARGGDYHVLLQIRGASPSVLARRLGPLFERSGQVTGSIIDIVELSNGVDILLLDRGSASKILRELRKHYRVRVKVTGEDVGVTSRGRLRRRQVISATLSERRRR